MSLLRTIARAFGLTDASVWRQATRTDSTAHKPVTVDAALQLATVWACVRLISETISTLPLLLYRRGGDDSRSVAADHPLYGLLHDSPNAEHTAVEFWEGVAASLCCWGNSYAERREIGSRLVALDPMSAELTVPYRDRDGDLRYRFYDRGRLEDLPASKVFHVRGFGACGDVGLSPISYARNSLGASMAADESAAKLFANGMQAAGVLTSDQTLKSEQRGQLQALMQEFVGSRNAHKLMVLEAGLKFQSIAMNPEDAQMLETRAFNVEEICRWFRVPPFMVGHTSKSTSWGTGLEQQNIGFLTYALRPYLTRIEQAIRRDLIRPEDRRSLFAEFKVEGLLRADLKSRIEAYALGVNAGIYSRDEVRSWENLPKRGGAADELTVQSQNVPLGQQAPSPAVAAPDDEE